MSPRRCYNASNNCRTGDFELYIWIVLFILIGLVLFFLFVRLCIKGRYSNRIGLEQYPTRQQNEYNVNSSEPPPYNCYLESPPPPYNSNKF